MDVTSDHHERTASDERLRILVVDKVAVLASNRLRWRRLAEQGDVDMTLLAPTHWIENCVDERYQPLGDEPFRTILGRPSLPGRELRSIYLSGAIRAVRQSRPDVLVMMEESFSLFALQMVLLARIFAPRARILFYSLNIVSYHDFPYRLSWFYRRIARIVMRVCDVGLCLNDRAVEVLRESSFTGEIRPLFFGINDEIFQPIDRTSARRSLGMPGNTEVILYAGRLLEQKGVQDLIQAFVLLCGRHPSRPLRLLIVGEGPYAEALMTQARATAIADLIEFRPAVSIELMPTLMSAADLFVLPSRTEWHEQFGRVNAEAMLVGTSIVGSTSGEIPRVIGDGGFIFPAGEIESLVDTLESALDNSAESNRRRAIGRERALKLFSMQGFVDGLIEILESLAGRRLRRTHNPTEA